MCLYKNIDIRIIHTNLIHVALSVIRPTQKSRDDFSNVKRTTIYLIQRKDSVVALSLSPLALCEETLKEDDSSTRKGFFLYYKS